jgi:hypothetical protein
VIENGKNWVLLQFQLIYWQPGSWTRAIPQLEQPKGGTKMRRTLKRTKSKKEQGRVRDLKPVREVKGSGKIVRAVEHHETAVTEDAKELKKLREEVTQIKSDIMHILEALQTLETWVPMSRTEKQQYAWAYRKFVDITSHLRQEARSR